MDARKKFTLFQLDHKGYPDSNDDYALFLIHLYNKESERTGFGEVQMILDHIKKNLYLDEIPQLALRLHAISRQTGIYDYKIYSAANDLFTEIVKAFWK